jgi:hypothetical protein
VPVITIAPALAPPGHATCGTGDGDGAALAVGLGEIAATLGVTNCVGVAAPALEGEGERAAVDAPEPHAVINITTTAVPASPLMQEG